MRALDGGVGSAGLEGWHGVSGVADEKDSPTLELVGDLLVGLPRRDIDDFNVDRLTDRPCQQLTAALRGELSGGLPAAGEVRGDEHAEVLAYRQKDAVHV